MAKVGVLLINLGTPDSPSVKDVRKYLREFLMDGRVIDIPYWRRLLLVQGIIAPFRAVESAKVYKKLWTKDGSPLLIYGQQVKDLLQESLGSDYVVTLGMRYQNPSIAEALNQLKPHDIERIIMIPLYPQYASASTGSTIEKFMQEIQSWEIVPHVEIVSQFPDHPLFIQAFVERGREYLSKGDYDHILFTYHGLPERQILKGSRSGYCQLSHKCCASYHKKNQFCYRAQCYQTTRLLAAELDLKQDQYTVCFQSRLGKTPWIKPYTDDVIKDLAKKGIKRILAFSPSFIADCLETTIEIGEEYNDLFKEEGGQHVHLVPSLNEHPTWIECLKQFVYQRVEEPQNIH